MKIAVLSGKGGTGKTFVSVNLAAVAPQDALPAYIDCDVEEPNGRLFFKPGDIETQSVKVKIPFVHAALCDGCRFCADFCRFNAIAMVKGKPVFFDEICHSCGGCALLCPRGAIAERDMVIGETETGVSGKVTVYTGTLNPGIPSGIPIIEKLLSDSFAARHKFAVIDCPPGSACGVMESIKNADYCVLMAEPTIFGAHNLAMVHELVTLFKKPHGVILNKCVPGENPSETFCVKNGAKILCRIPFDQTLGACNAGGNIIVRESKKYQNVFTDLLQKIQNAKAAPFVWHSLPAAVKKGG